MARDRRFGSVRRLPSGKWQARYTWEALEHKAPRTFASRDAAEAWLRTKRTELDTGWILTRERRRRSVTFSEYAQGWLEERQDLKPRTKVLYAGQLDRYLLPALGQLTVNAITTDTVREWWRRMDPDKATARAHAYALLRTILEAARKDDPPLIDVNPCRLREAGSPPRRRHRIQPATPAELATIVENMPPQLRAAVLLSAWGGLRWGEVAELRRKDLSGNVVHVTRAVVRLPGGDPETVAARRRPRFVVGDPKSEAGIRAVTLPSAIMPAIQAHLDAMEDKRPDALLFHAKSNPAQHLAVSTLNKVWHPARAAAGRPDLRWHDLRHTGAVFAAQAGATLAELMARLGHSTHKAALRYQHAAADRDARIAEALSAMVEAGSPRRDGL
jgi:integrase